MAFSKEKIALERKMAVFDQAEKIHQEEKRAMAADKVDLEHRE